MRWFNNMKIGAKLILSFIIVAIISGVVGTIGIQNINKINENAVVLYDNVTIPLSEAAEMAKSFQIVKVILRDMILESDTTAINNLYDEIKTTVNDINTNAASFESTIIAENIKEAYAEFDTARTECRAYLEQFLQLCLENRDEEAIILINGDLHDATMKEQNAIDKLIQLKVDAAKERSEQNKKTLQSAIITMVAVIATGMLIAIMLGIFISRLISRPIQKVAKAAELIADGDLNIDMNIVSKDEIGSLAASFRKMINNLNEVMFNIGLAAEQVASGSKQVSDSSMALSQGATEQAASIEELSSSIEEIAVQTKQNAENAIQANQLADTAKDNAASGNNQMMDMLKAMEDINVSSNNISKIIKVIDDIAFQTNILALNAAVEAARAGQHGKGFAVVAEEVRSLAARSAKASKETTDMIEGSIRKVDGGMKIANQTAQALTSIVDNVTKVASLVGSIAIASNEQASGVEQINQGIMQVSTVVQTNSATSQESAAASEELSSQAELMREQVMKFKLKKQDKSYPYYQDKEYSGVKSTIKYGNTQGSRKIQSPGNYKPKEDIKIILNDAEFGKY